MRTYSLNWDTFVKKKKLLNVCVPPNPYVKILNPKEDGVKRWKLLEMLMSCEWNPHEWISVHLEETPQDSLIPSTTEDTVNRWQLWARRKIFTRTWPGWCLDLRLLATRAVRNKLLLFRSYPVYAISLQQSEWTKKITFYRILWTSFFPKQDLDTDLMKINLLPFNNVLEIPSSSWNRLGLMKYEKDLKLALHSSPLKKCSLLR